MTNEEISNRHVEEMYNELRFVQQKLNGLIWFINNIKLFNDRIKTIEQKQLVEEQIKVMNQYIDILQKRINYFENEAC